MVAAVFLLVICHALLHVCVKSLHVLRVVRVRDVHLACQVPLQAVLIHIVEITVLTGILGLL